jgi:ABC-type bacteriocin/lantibiotic exporter with double-glycine peptidase domain
MLNKKRDESTMRIGKLWHSELITSVMPQLGELLFVSFFINLLAVGVPVFVLQVYDRVVFQGCTGARV